MIGGDTKLCLTQALNTRLVKVIKIKHSIQGSCGLFNSSTIGVL